MEKVQEAIVFKGGGALAAFEVGMVARLYELPGFRPEIVTGASFGALNAVGFVGTRGDPMENLRKIWKEFSSAPPWMEVSPHLNWTTSTSYYDTTPIRKILDKFVDFQTLNRSSVKVAISTIDIESGAVNVFDNHSSSSILTPEHILAAVSMPPGFPVKKINGRCYWDSVLFDNTPLASAQERMNTDARTRLFVANPTGTVEGTVPENLVEVNNRILERLFSSSMAYDLFTVSRTQEVVHLINQIDNLLDMLDDPIQVAEIRSSPAYLRLKRGYPIHEIIVVENRKSKLISSPFDFNQLRISQDMEEAYRATDAAVVQLTGNPNDVA